MKNGTEYKSGGVCYRNMNMKGKLSDGLHSLCPSKHQHTVQPSLYASMGSLSYSGKPSHANKLQQAQSRDIINDTSPTEEGNNYLQHILFFCA